MSWLLDAWIASTGLAALALLQFGGSRARRAAPWFGLAGQPAWVWLALEAGSFGVLAVVCAYTLLWAAGCWKSLESEQR